jgi:hypothetical protein
MISRHRTLTFSWRVSIQMLAEITGCYRCTTQLTWQDHALIAFATRIPERLQIPALLLVCGALCCSLCPMSLSLAPQTGEVTHVTSKMCCCCCCCCYSSLAMRQECFTKWNSFKCKTVKQLGPRTGGKRCKAVLSRISAAGSRMHTMTINLSSKESAPRPSIHKIQSIPALSHLQPYNHNQLLCMLTNPLYTS